MKALSVKQPWASVLCAGIKDVENRTWQTKGAPGRILIHATKTKVESNYEGYPDDYISTIKNARTMGQITYLLRNVRDTKTEQDRNNVTVAPGNSFGETVKSFH